MDDGMQTCETIRQLFVIMLTRRAAAFVAMRPTLLFKLATLNDCVKQHGQQSMAFGDPPRCGVGGLWVEGNTAVNGTLRPSDPGV
jgi:hypothetical protein